MKAFFYYIISCIFLVGLQSPTHGQEYEYDILPTDSLEIPTDAISENLENLDSLIDRYSLDQGGKVTESVENILAKAAGEVNRQIDSLQQILEKPMEYPKRIVNKTDSLLTGITNKVSKLQKKIKSKTGSIANEGGISKNLNDATEINQLFDKCDLIEQKNLMKDLPNLDDLKIKNFQSSIGQLNAGDKYSSKLPTDISSKIESLVGSKDLNSYLDSQLKQMGIPGTKEWKKVSKDPAYLDKTIDQYANKFKEANYLNENVGKLDKVKKVTDSMLKEVPKPGEEKDLMNRGKKLVIKNAKNYLSGHEEKLQAAQSQLSKLKKKYSYVGSATDMKNAKKANSLKGEPLKRRLVVGGNFNLQRGKPTSLDLSPLLMYKFTKDFYIGVSGTFRVKLGDEDKINTTVTQDVKGFSLFGEFKIRNGFFGYTECEYLSSPNLTQVSTDKEQRIWQEGLLLGLGKKFSFTKGLTAQIILTYNALYDKDYTPSNSPWNFKFGILSKQLSLPKLKF